MRYLLDTNIISDFYDDESKNQVIIANKLKELQGSVICVSLLSLFELEYGFANSPTQEKERVRKVIFEVETNYHTFPITKNLAKLFGEIKKEIKDFRNISKKNIRRHNIDIILASTAIEEKCTLISGDEIFEDIAQIRSDFQFVNWLN